MDRHAGACAKLHASFKKKNLVPEGRGSSFATSQFAQCAICVGAYFPKMLQPLAAAGAAAFFEAFFAAFFGAAFLTAFFGAAFLTAFLTAFFAAFFGAAFLTAFFLATAMVFTSLQLPGYFGPRFV
jgi:hypothetical protein